MAVKGILARLYLDDHVHPWFIRNLCEHGFDVIRSDDAGNRRVSDEAHFRWAARNQRTVLSYDRNK